MPKGTQTSGEVNDTDWIQVKVKMEWKTPTTQ